LFQPMGGVGARLAEWLDCARGVSVPCFAAPTSPTRITRPPTAVAAALFLRTFGRRTSFRLAQFIEQSQAPSARFTSPSRLTSVLLSPQVISGWETTGIPEPHRFLGTSLRVSGG